MKNLLFLIVFAITVFSGCVKDDVYEPPTPEAGDVVLNEIKSKGPDGDDNDFVELYNKGEVEADISGYLINDAADPLGGFVIPAGTKIAAKGFYDVHEPELTIAVSSGGEDVSFGTAEGVLLDLVTVPASQADGLSFSRIPDGEDTWLNGTEATPGAANVGDASIPSMTIEYSVAPAAGTDVEVIVTTSSSETIAEVSAFYASGDSPTFDENNKIVGVIGTDNTVLSMTGLNVADEKVSFFVAITLANGDAFYYDNEHKNVEFDAIKADPTKWESYTAVVGGLQGIIGEVIFTEGENGGNLNLTFTGVVDAPDLVDEVRFYYVLNDDVHDETVTPPLDTKDKVKIGADEIDDDGNFVGVLEDLPNETLVTYYFRVEYLDGTKIYTPNEETDADGVVTSEFNHDKSSTWPSVTMGNLPVNGFSGLVIGNEAGSDLTFDVTYEYDVVANPTFKSVKLYYTIDKDYTDAEWAQAVADDDAGETGTLLDNRIDIEIDVMATDNKYSFSIPAADVNAGEIIRFYFRGYTKDVDGEKVKEYFTEGQGAEFDHDIYSQWAELTVN